MSDLEAGPALDRQVAEALGWRVVWKVDCPAFSADLHAAMDHLTPWLQERASALTWGGGDRELQVWEITVWQGAGWRKAQLQAGPPWYDAQPSFVSGATLALALCAAVLAVSKAEEA